MADRHDVRLLGFGTLKGKKYVTWPSFSPFNFPPIIILLLLNLSLFSPSVVSRAADESFCPAPISPPFLRLRVGQTEHRKEGAVIMRERELAGRFR